MSVSTDIYSQALNLPLVQREELAILLFESLSDDDSPVEVSEEFEEEIHRRLEEHRLGQDKTVGLDTFLETIRTAGKSSEPK
jgi:putative addiction module component (TIGR02574 family)